MITIDDFKKLEIKIGTVLTAERVPDSDKLIKFMFDIGTGTPRQILAGIAAAYPDPSVLVGRQMPVLLNLEPRQLRGLMSDGMTLAVSGENGPVLLHPDQAVPPGSEVR